LPRTRVESELEHIKGIDFYVNADKDKTRRIKCRCKGIVGVSVPTYRDQNAFCPFFWAAARWYHGK
jgi:hypothetical protein